MKQPAFELVMLAFLLLPAGAMGAPPAPTDQNTISIIPQPLHLTQQAGTFILRPDTCIVTKDAQLPLGHALADMLDPATGFSLKVGPSDQQSNIIRLKLDVSQATGPEGYHLEASPTVITISAAAPAGIFYGMQTLRQLLPPAIFSPTLVQGVAWTVPAVSIDDRPRFAWRGMMLDCSRHFMPPQFIKRFIDLLAIHKMNTFHWHLTDDQGWRIQIRKYPKLTEIGAWRSQTLIGRPDQKPLKFDGQRYGGFYTQDEIRDIVAYAQDRFINIVPEIEMPGHSSAAIAAYPQLSYADHPVAVATSWGICSDILAPEQNTIDFYQDVLREVMDLFPSRFIHLGGDEVPLAQWNNPRALARMKELGLTDPADLQQYFLAQMNRYLQANGRRLIGWDEVAALNPPPGAIVMYWHSVKGAAQSASAGHDVVLAPKQYTYFNYYQSRDTAAEPLAKNFLSLEQVYDFQPIPSGLAEAAVSHILGVQGQLWTEYIPTPAICEYMAYPRACALADIAWGPADRQDYPQFLARLDMHLRRLSEMKVNYRPPTVSDATTHPTQ
jgi:hexosaminidase